MWYEDKVDTNPGHDFMAFAAVDGDPTHNILMLNLHSDNTDHELPATSYLQFTLHKSIKHYTHDAR